MKRARARYYRLISFCLSDGGIGIHGKHNYIHFTSQSTGLLNRFKAEIKKFTTNKIHEQQKARGITLRVFDQKLSDKLLDISPSFRTKACNHFPVCPILKGRKINRMHRHVKIGKDIFAEIKIPEDIFASKAEKSEFLRIYASCDGYPSLFPHPKSWAAVSRIVAIVCHNPILKSRLSELLNDLDIQHVVKPYSLEMTSEDSIRSFEKKIRFLDGATMTGNSKYWYGLPKNDVLDKILKSYKISFKSRKKKHIIFQLKTI